MKSVSNCFLYIKMVASGPKKVEQNQRPCRRNQIIRGNLFREKQRKKICRK